MKARVKAQKAKRMRAAGPTGTRTRNPRTIVLQQTRGRYESEPTDKLEYLMGRMIGRALVADAILKRRGKQYLAPGLVNGLILAYEALVPTKKIEVSRAKAEETRGQSFKDERGLRYDVTAEQRVHLDLRPDRQGPDTAEGSEPE